MSMLIPALFEDATIRLVETEGELWFVGKDVAEVLGYANPSDAMNQHCKGVAKRYPLQTAGGVQEVRILSEPDVLRLIVSSKLPTAERFERWVFEDVLPTIRKTGSYGPSPQLVPAAGTGPNFAADRIVGAARTLSALIRAGKAMGMSDARAAYAANSATTRVTGVNLADELGYCIPEALPMQARENDFQTQCQTILQIIERAGSRGMTRREIASASRAWRRMEPDEHEAILNALLKTGRAICYMRGGARGAKSQSFVATPYNSRSEDDDDE